MAQYPYVNNPVVLQLIRTPPSSQELLDGIRRGATFNNPAEAAEALVRAKGWVRTPLKDEFAPPKDIRLVAIMRENGGADVIRGIFSAGDLELDTAQARQLLSLRIRGSAHQSGKTPSERAETAAHVLFRMGERLHFEELGTFAGRTWGKQSPAPGQAVDPDWPHWHDRLHWWTTPDELGFVTLKASGGPTREVIGPFEEMNVVWFRK